MYQKLESLVIEVFRNLPLAEFAVKDPKTISFLASQILKLGLQFQRESPVGAKVPSMVKQEKYEAVIAILHQISKKLKVGSNSAIGLVDPFLKEVFVGGIGKRKKFYEERGFRAPSFVTISPTNNCNLRCKGCYANEPFKIINLDYEIFNQIINECESYGINFFVISGGEPFMYKSKGKSLVDVLKEHKSSWFLIFTNGTLLSEKTVKELSEIGNLTLAISSEGRKKETDERRGKGVYDKIIKAKELCNRYGLIHGSSLTLTKENFDTIMDEEFFFEKFEKEKDSYVWIFHYMPIGRNPNPSLMPTPEQRLKARKLESRLVKEKKWPIFDFWNSGTLSDGCISAGRGGGYFYIMWTGEITPCVFIPFKDKEINNVYELYKNGKSIFDVLDSKLFKAIREWQIEYGKKGGNQLMPCPIRDHATKFREIVLETRASPIDKEASLYLSFCVPPFGFMCQYNEECRKLLGKEWEKIRR